MSDTAALLHEKGLKCPNSRHQTDDNNTYTGQLLATTEKRARPEKGAGASVICS